MRAGLYKAKMLLRFRDESGRSTQERRGRVGMNPQGRGPALYLLVRSSRQRCAVVASLMSPCLCASEEQFVLSQVALLEQVNALMPVLDSASIKGTPVGSYPTLMQGEVVGGARASLSQRWICSLEFYPVGTYYLAMVTIPE